MYKESRQTKNIRRNLIGKEVQLYLGSSGENTSRMSCIYENKHKKRLFFFSNKVGV